MRLISAALLGAAATLPSLAHAATTIPDPTDAAAPVQAITNASAFDGYRAYRDGDGPTWLQMNNAVLEKRVKGSVKRGGTSPAQVDSNSKHGEAAK